MLILMEFDVIGGWSASVVIMKFSNFDLGVDYYGTVCTNAFGAAWC